MYEVPFILGHGVQAGLGQQTIKTVFGCDGGQRAGDNNNNEVKILNEVMGGRLIARRAGDTTIKM